MLDAVLCCRQARAEPGRQLSQGLADLLSEHLVHHLHFEDVQALTQ